MDYDTLIPGSWKQDELPSVESTLLPLEPTQENSNVDARNETFVGNSQNTSSVMCVILAGKTDTPKISYTSCSSNNVYIFFCNHSNVLYMELNKIT